MKLIITKKKENKFSLDSNDFDFICDGLSNLDGCKRNALIQSEFRVHELCESRGGRPGLSVLMSLTVFVDVKQQ